MLSAIFLVPETVMNLHQIFRAGFWYQFLLRVSPALQPLLEFTSVRYLPITSYCTAILWSVKTFLFD